MKKLIVFLHNFGGSVETDNPEFQNELAKQLNCDLVGINGIYDSGRERGGYGYYPITPGDRRHLLDGYLDKSLAYLQGRIDAELDKRDLTWNDLILVGHSHGGAIALLLGLRHQEPCHAIIEIAGRALKSYGLEFTVNSKPPVMWVEAEDNDKGRSRCKESADTIEELGIPVDYHICPKSGHEVLDFNIISIIKDNLR